MSTLRRLREVSRELIKADIGHVSFCSKAVSIISQFDTSQAHALAELLTEVGRECPHCGKKCVNEQSLNDHLWSKHPEVKKAKS